MVCQAHTICNAQWSGSHHGCVLWGLAVVISLVQTWSGLGSLDVVLHAVRRGDLENQVNESEDTPSKTALRMASDLTVVLAVGSSLPSHFLPCACSVCLVWWCIYPVVVVVVIRSSVVLLALSYVGTSISCPHVPARANCFAACVMWFLAVSCQACLLYHVRPVCSYSRQSAVCALPWHRVQCLDTDLSGEVPMVPIYRYGTERLAWIRGLQCVFVGSAR